MVWDFVYGAIIWRVAFIILYLGHGRCQDVRLVPGPDRGRLEVYYNGMWGTVCGFSSRTIFDNKAATVVCRSLNQPTKNAHRAYRTDYGAGILHRRITSVKCSGSENSLFNCSLISTSSTARCYYAYAVGVVCTENKVHPSLRLHSMWINSSTQLDVREKSYMFCYSTNRPDFSYFNTSIVSKTQSQETASTLSYIIITKADQGPVKCTVSNWQWPNQSSLTVDVNVLYGPSSSVISNLKVLENTAANISLTNIPKPLPFSTVWKKKENGYKWEQKEMYLVYDNISRHDHGHYTVNITNRIVTKSGFNLTRSGYENMTVDVLYEPTVQCEKLCDLEQGSEVRVSCDVDANPPANSFKWTNEDGHIVKQGSEPSLVFTSITPEDAGVYTLTARNTMVDSKGNRKSGTGRAVVTVSLVPPSTPTATTTTTVQTVQTDALGTEQRTCMAPAVSPALYVMIVIAVISLIGNVICVNIIIRFKRRGESPEMTKIRSKPNISQPKKLNVSTVGAEKEKSTTSTRGEPEATYVNTFKCDDGGYTNLKFDMAC